MESIKVTISIALVISAGVALRLLLDRDDRVRIRRHIESQGGKLLGAQQDAWEDNSNGRLYDVCYLDAEEKKHRTQYRTRLFSLAQEGRDVIEDDLVCPFDEQSENRLHEES